MFAAGRDPQRLAALPTDHTILLGTEDDDALAPAADVDVVLDYLWGHATQRALPAVLTRRADRGRPLTWIQIGSVAGLDLTLSSAWLRAARLSLIGSGQGSVPTRDIVAELPALAAHVTATASSVGAVAVPLRDVEAAWAAPRDGRRIVLVPRAPSPGGHRGATGR